MWPPAAASTDASRVSWFTGCGGMCSLPQGFCSSLEPLAPSIMNDTDRWGGISALASILFGSALTRTKGLCPLLLHAMLGPVCFHSGPRASALSLLSSLSPSRLLCPPVVTADTRQKPPAPPYAADSSFSLCFHAQRWTPDVTRESITMWAGWREGRICQRLLSVHRPASAEP